MAAIAKTGYCWKLSKHFTHFASITRALLVRLVFTLHALACIIVVQRFNDGIHFWFLNLSLSGLFMESLVVIIRRRGQEWMWYFIFDLANF